MMRSVLSFWRLDQNWRCASGKARQGNGFLSLDHGQSFPRNNQLGDNYLFADPIYRGFLIGIKRQTKNVLGKLFDIGNAGHKNIRYHDRFDKTRFFHTDAPPTLRVSFLKQQSRVTNRFHWLRSTALIVLGAPLFAQVREDLRTFVQTSLQKEATSG